jgi:molybdopterin-guanine dinucleotide biosynthesis protein A
MNGGVGRIGAIVLAGGRSSRFGRDKLAEPVDGRPLLEYAIDAVRAVAAEVVVVLPPGVDRALPADVIVAHDERAFEGPLAGVAAGLDALPEDIDRCLVVGGDMPTLSPAVLRLLISAVAAPGATAAVLDDGGPMPMAVRPRAAAPAARALLADGERRLRALPERLSATVIAGAAWRVHDPAAATLRDIDTTDDL